MDRNEWDACTDPDKLIYSKLLSKRTDELRLFMLACLQDVRELLPKPGCLALFTTFRDYLVRRMRDKKCDLAEIETTLRRTAPELLTMRRAQSLSEIEGTAALALYSALSESPDLHVAASSVSDGCVTAACWVSIDSALASAMTEDEADQVGEIQKEQLRQLHCDFLRCLCCHPNYKPRSLKADLRDKPCQQIHAVVNALYFNPSEDGMKVLADLLEESGVSDPSILQHLRDHSVHIPGCYALSAIREATRLRLS
jgi:hypothetical protein